MKLIDADALEEAIMMTGAVKVKDEETAYEFAGILANAPAVDAIPVEWLRERKHWAAIDGDYWAENIISYLLKAWQEGKHETD